MLFDSYLAIITLRIFWLVNYHDLKGERMLGSRHNRVYWMRAGGHNQRLCMPPPSPTLTKIDPEETPKLAFSYMRDERRKTEESANFIFMHMLMLMLSCSHVSCIPYHISLPNSRSQITDHRIYLMSHTAVWHSCRRGYQIRLSSSHAHSD